jgi:thiol-disulfide isomerase/thioredoxin
MRILFLITLLLAGHPMTAQKTKKIFYDSAGRVTTWDNYMAQLVGGKYKLSKSGNFRTLVKMTPEEQEVEVRRTEKKITRTDKIGKLFPDFDREDVSGNRLAKSELKGKVLVINFWFVGCPPCEMERPSLNGLTEIYKDNKDVVFISFARNSKEQLIEFLKESPVHYHVVPTEKDYIPTTFAINGYPANLIVGRDGNYFYNSAASGIGIQTILRRQIDKALKQ